MSRAAAHNNKPVGGTTDRSPSAGMSGGGRPRRRYAVVGTGSRSRMYLAALSTTYRDRAQLVALCDTNSVRLGYAARRWRDLADVREPDPRTCGPDDFAEVLAVQGVEEVIVTTIDRAHHHYVVAALEAGCDVICEKPLTIDAAKCLAILDAERRSGRRLRVTFNYRYSPRNAALTQLLRDGAVGVPISVHFEWLLDTVHGADYFRRWHRDKLNSGGLMVHKASHHFDLVNWWLGAVPATVFGLGDLRFYGRANAESRGVRRFYQRGTGLVGGEDPFALDLSTDADLAAMYLDAEAEDGYLRDQSVFSDGISIEDDMAVLVRYDTGATMSYHLTAYAPREGYRVAVNGSEGRLELDVEESSYVSGGGAGPGRGRERTSLVLLRHWEKPTVVPVEGSDAHGHGGGDERLLDDLFGEPSDDPLGRSAGSLEGAWAMVTGVAANRSFASGLPVTTASLLPGLARPGRK